MVGEGIVGVDASLDKCDLGDDEGTSSGYALQRTYTRSGGGRKTRIAERRVLATRIQRAIRASVPWCQQCIADRNQEGRRGDGVEGEAVVEEVEDEDEGDDDEEEQGVK